jgi:hypothetical protein
LFIDANKYLDLYRTNQGKKLLAPLGEQKRYIFITEQIVSEVQRNKVSVAADFLGDKTKGLKLQTFNVPDHLSGDIAGQGEDILQQLRDIGQRIEKANGDADTLALGIIKQISCSEDEVSRSLAPIFANAIAHSPEELQRARDRREVGNPPGKHSNALGDQLTWEQILTRFEGKRRLWVISRDDDYGTTFSGKGFLNTFLYDELCKISPEPEVYLFRDISAGIEHFVSTTGVKADNRLTPEEIEDIEQEEKSLPTINQSGEDSLRPTFSEGMLSKLRDHVRERDGIGRVAQVDLVSLNAIAKHIQKAKELQRTMAGVDSIARISQQNKDISRRIAEMGGLEELNRKMTEASRLMAAFGKASVTKHAQIDEDRSSSPAAQDD